jgi:integrase
MRMAEPLIHHLSGLPGTDDPQGFVFPRFAAMGENVTAALSKAFAEEILIPAGLMLPQPKNHASAGTGRKNKRHVNEVTFHSLRHSWVTTARRACGGPNLAMPLEKSAS